MSNTVADHAHDHSHGHDDHAHDHPHGWRRYLFATNHKDIGNLYLWFSFTMLMAGGVMALLIRSELFQPGLQLMQPEFFNQLTTMHVLVMVFGAIMPAFVGFANWMIPLQIGASDMAFARMNNFSFWLMPPAALLLIGSFFVPGGATAAGWTFVCTVVDTNGSRYGHGDFRGPHHGCVFHRRGFDQHHHHHLEHARSGHDFDEDANVLLDMVDYCLLVDRCDASVGRRDYHDFD